MRGDIQVVPQIRDELEALLIREGWFPKAPFNWIGLTIRYGLKTEDAPHYARVDKEDGELPIAIEVDTHRILELDRQPEQLKAFFKSVVVACLLSVARRYQLPSEELAKQADPSGAA